MNQEATDPTLIAAISGGAAILGGLLGGGLGYRGVVTQMKEERRLEHLQRRREVYLDFFDAAMRFMRGSGVLRYDDERWRAFFPEYERAYSAVLLVAIPSVREAAVQVQLAFRAMMEDVDHGEGVSPVDAREAALLKHEDSIRDALTEMEGAMRDDIGPV
jgi:hypothetical protein